MSLLIRSMQPDDATAVLGIYAEGIATGMATFETTVPTWEAWDANHLAECRLAAQLDGRVVGWAALSPFSRRAVYAGVAEISIYVAHAARGQGVGKALLEALVAASEAAGFWTLQAGIFAINQASRRLHQACGFREVGYREKIGQCDGAWQDTILMERRSRKVAFSGS